MTPKQQHSPTPWHRHGAMVYHGGGDNPEAFVIAECWEVANEFGRKGNAEDNAAFIVRACNSHDALVHAVETAYRAATERLPGDMEREAERVRDVLRRALVTAGALGVGALLAELDPPKPDAYASALRALETAAPILDSFLNGGGEYVEPDAIDAALMQVREALRLARGDGDPRVTRREG